MSYHQFKTQDPEESFGSFEIFQDLSHPFGPGWFWQSCFPGCIPDSEAYGPFKSEDAAFEDAHDFAEF